MLHHYRLVKTLSGVKLHTRVLNTRTHTEMQSRSCRSIKIFSKGSNADLHITLLSLYIMSCCWY